MIRSTLLAAVMATVAMAQSTVNYTDSTSGIKFSYYTSGDGVNFGVALPETNSNDFIGILESSTLDGYAAMSMTGEMAGGLLICAWPNGDNMVASLRKATGYTNPSQISNSSMGIYEISSGTAINSTGWQFTFLCKGCVNTDISFADSDTEAVFGYARSTTALTDTTSSDATLNYHSAAFGEYAHSIADAKSSDYATWAATASSTNLMSSSTSSNSSTSAGSSSNSTITTTTSNSTYDYIVAGAGPAGIIVAERLVESGASVLLLEKGGSSLYSTGGDDVMTYNDTVTQYDVPGMGYYLTDNAATQYCTDTGGMAGCLLGGSGMVNAMMFVKPPEHDFDDKWPTGWKWSDVQSSAESFYERTPGFILANGSGVDQAAFNLVSGFLSANGFSQTDALASPNEKEAVFSHPPWLIRDGLRGGPVKDYLPLAQGKSNFKLSLNTSLVRVVRDNETATGVEVELASGNRQLINLNTGGSVVLAGGALSTPRMLINSGIGPKAQIQTVQSGSVSVTLPAESDWIELPVGQNMQDHPIFTVTLTTKDTLDALESTAFTNPNETVVSAFNDESTGLLAQAGQRINFWTTTTANDSTTPYYVQGTINAPADNTIRIKTYLTHGITSTGVLEVTADGATTITTSPYLQTTADKAAITNFMNKLISMVSASTEFEAITDTAAELIASDNISQGDHYVGTARMGTANDGTSVVDTNCKVWGTDNIYVVDASIHPDLPTGNSQAIIMVAAEHAAKVILAADSTTADSGSSSSSSSTTSSASTGDSSSSGSTTSGSSSSDSSSSPKKCKKRRAAAELAL